MLKALIGIATFDIPYVEMGSVSSYKVIEEDESSLSDMPESLLENLDELGYDSAVLSKTMGSVFVFTLVTIIALIVIVLTDPVMQLPFQWSRRTNLWLSNFLCWNFVIRLIFEGALESTFSVWLCFKYGTFSSDYWGTVIDWAIAVLLAACLLLMPAWMFIFYIKRVQNWAKPSFQEKYGAPLDGLKPQRTSLIYPIYFMVRRMSFALMSMTLFNHVVLQLTFHWLLTTLAFAFLATFQPFQETMVGKLEMLNEGVTVLLIDLCFLFTPLEPSASRQYSAGYFFNALVIGTLCVHVFFLLKNTFTEVKWRLLVWRARRFSVRKKIQKWKKVVKSNLKKPPKVTIIEEVDKMRGRREA